MYLSSQTIDTIIKKQLSFSFTSPHIKKQPHLPLTQDYHCHLLRLDLKFFTKAYRVPSFFHRRMILKILTYTLKRERQLCNESYNTEANTGRYTIILSNVRIVILLKYISYKHIILPSTVKSPTNTTGCSATRNLILVVCYIPCLTFLTFHLETTLAHKPVRKMRVPCFSFRFKDTLKTTLCIAIHQSPLPAQSSIVIRGDIKIISLTTHFVGCAVKWYNVIKILGIKQQFTLI